MSNLTFKKAPRKAQVQNYPKTQIELQNVRPTFK